VKLDRNGNIQWQKCFGGSNDEGANSIIQTSDGGYIFAGITNSIDGDVSGYHSGLFLPGDVWVVKINSSGGMQWQRCFGGSELDGANSIIQSSEGNIVIAGESSSHNGDLDSNIHSDSWIIKLNDKGDIKWQRSYGGGWASKIITTSDNGFAFSGYGGRKDSTTFTSWQYNAWVTKLDPDTGQVNSVENYSSTFINNYIKIYPNPSSVNVNFSAASNLSLLTAGFYDVMGRQYFPNYSLESNSISCDVHDFPPGIYLARLGWSGRVYWQKQDYPGSFTVPFVVAH
jgi:hypothetical protein